MLSTQLYRLYGNSFLKNRFYGLCSFQRPPANVEVKEDFDNLYFVQDQKTEFQ